MAHGKRFLVVVFNYGRLDSLTTNLEKLVDLDFSLDTLVIYDCSEDGAKQRAALASFCERKGWTQTGSVLFWTRANWGLAEGGRLDLANKLRNGASGHRYMLQFQDHYLDTTSVHSIWPAGTRSLDGADLSGKVKGDCIRDNHALSLSQYERLLRDGIADILYSSQDGIGLFPYWDENFFCIDGVNFASTIPTYLKIFDEPTCLKLRSTWDQTYDWALFAEHYVGYRMKKLGLTLCDSFYKVTFTDVLELIRKLDSVDSFTELLHVSERHYGILFRRYMEEQLM